MPGALPRIWRRRASLRATPPTVFLIAGEPSGDAIGARLMRALRDQVRRAALSSCAACRSLFPDVVVLLTPSTSLRCTSRASAARRWSPRAFLHSSPWVSSRSPALLRCATPAGCAPAAQKQVQRVLATLMASRRPPCAGGPVAPAASCEALPDRARGAPRQRLAGAVPMCAPLALVLSRRLVHTPGGGGATERRGGHRLQGLQPARSSGTRATARRAFRPPSTLRAHRFGAAPCRTVARPGSVRGAIGMGVF